MLNQRTGLIFGFLVVFLIAFVMGLLSITLFIQDVFATRPVNCSTRGMTANAPSDPIVSVQNYLKAIKNKDFNRACTYFDPKATIAVGKKVKPVSIDLMKSLVVGKDVIKSYSIFSMSSVTGNLVVIFVDVIHGSRNQLSVLHLWIHQQGGGWKIEREEVPSV